MSKYPISLAWCRAICLFLAIAAAGLAADLATKYWAFDKLGMPVPYVERITEPGTIHWVWQDVFGFQTMLNPGALFGIAAGQITFLVTFSLIFLVGILTYVTIWAWRSLFMTATFGMITAGICGNLYDRLGWHGLVYPDFAPCHPWWQVVNEETGLRLAEQLAGEPILAVRDWILVMIGTFHWPNFNIADMLLVSSLILLLVHAAFFDKQQPTDAEPQEVTKSPDDC